jgi:uncharacterized protein YkwD
MARARMLVVAAVMVLALAFPATSSSADTAANQMIAKVNDYRHSRGLPSLRVSPSLDHSAARYARRMMASGYFGHSGRIQASSRFRRLGEILEMHRGRRANVSGALREWINSPGHNAILLDRNFTWVGAGKVTGRYQGRPTTMWVMHFGR